MLKINDILDLSHTIAKEVFLDSVYPWEVLKKIGDYIWNWVKPWWRMSRMQRWEYLDF
jgi:hypothetical protein